MTKYVYIWTFMPRQCQKQNPMYHNRLVLSSLHKIRNQKGAKFLLTIIVTRVAITNYHKIDGLKQYIFILSQLQRLEVQNKGLKRALPHPKSLVKKPSLSFSLLLDTLGNPHISWLVAPSLISAFTFTGPLPTFAFSAFLMRISVAGLKAYPKSSMISFQIFN